MAAVQTRGNTTGNFLKKELWPEEFYCRANITVTKAGLGRTDGAGEVVSAATVGGTYAALDGSLGADVCAIIVDPDVDDKIAAAGATMVVAALINGPSVIRKGGLELANETEAAAVYAQLESQDFKFAELFSFKQQTLTV